MESISLAAERIERAALADLHAAASPHDRAALGLEARAIGGVLASMAAKDSGTLLNRALGLGVEEAASPETVREVAACYASRKIRRFYFHLHPDARPPGLDQALREAGFTKGRGWRKFHHDLAAPPPEAACDLHVSLIDRAHAQAFGRIVSSAFGLPEACADLLASLPGREGWRVYMSFDGEAPAGAGALFVRDGAGWLDWAATDPAFRKRGGQGLVLRERIRAARELGCRHLFTATGEAVPGDPQHSYKNILKAGFREAYLRENWVPAA